MTSWVYAYDRLQEKCIDAITINNILLFLTNRFHVDVGLYNKRLQKMSKCVKNINDTLGFALSASFLFSPHFGIICDLLLTD